MMMKCSVHQENIKITNVYAPDKWVPKYVKQKLTELKRERDNSTLKTDCLIPLS